MNLYLYGGIIGSVLFIISCFIYALYAYIPFFNTAETSQIGKPTKDLRLFINQQKNPSNITTNLEEDYQLRNAFLISFLIILLFTFLFLTFSFFRTIPVLDGIFASSTILALPALWVFNFIIAINYFYVYPIILIMLRFIRYGIMSSLFIITQNSDKIKENFSEDLIKILDNFKNYSPSWGLIGIDEFKLWLGICGFNNEFSKYVIPDNYNSANLSQNKFVSSGYFSFLVNFISDKDSNNMKGIVLSGVTAFLTIVISLIILSSVVKI
jgi:hypothetical protein